ncbi:hypothetical protein T12_8576 [Trichinella patagoniensis]|uniref:Uncharacterized protein n=1 Tax=Trichinella patagoniensis TaxID=990121 RepID=A0A0V0YFY0_9BILA|nr:hypothetical protein T12_8576 [Trichinella patagoniensis]
MSLFAIMEHPSLTILPRMLLLICACYVVVLAVSSFYAMYVCWVYA